MSDSKTSEVFEVAKLLAKTVRQADEDPQIQIMALRAAASQIEQEITMTVQTSVLLKAMNGE
jgi:hypothetical protein